MRLLGRRKKEEKPLSEERKKEYFEFGRKIGLKLGLPEKVRKTNAFYARHPKTMSLFIFGICCTLMVLSQLNFSGAERHAYRMVGHKPSDYTASTLFDAMDMHTSSIDKLNGITPYHKRLRFLVDSLQQLENPTEEDSIRLAKGFELLNKIEGGPDNGL